MLSIPNAQNWRINGIGMSQNGEGWLASPCEDKTFKIIDIKTGITSYFVAIYFLRLNVDIALKCCMLREKK